VLITPKQLWQDFDPKELDFAVTIVREREFDTHLEQYLYFNAVKTTDGVVRACAKLYTPKNLQNSTAVTVFDDIFNSVDSFDPTSYLAKGFAVLVVDYAGERNDNKRYTTIYPPSFNFAYYHKNPDTITVCDDPHFSCWYIWGIIAIRANAYLESLGYKNRFSLGFGHGGENVWKISHFENAMICGATVFSGGLIDSDNLAYKTALDSSSYALSAKSPIFIQVTSNELNDSLDEFNELYEASISNNESRFSILEKSMRCIDYKRVDNPLIWFLLYLEKSLAKRCSEKIVECPPSVLIHSSEQKLYCDVVVPDYKNLEKVELFVCYGDNSPSTRFWRNIQLQMVSESEYLAKLDTASPEKPLFVFATAEYKSGLYLSSSISSIIPHTLGIKAPARKFKRLLYDIDMGISNFTISNWTKSEYQLFIKEGPLGLQGLTSTINSGSTYLLADDEFKPKDNLSLQFMLYSSEAQKVEFSILCSKTHNKFITIKELDGNNSWEKITLSHEELKFENTPLKDWNSVLTFTINSEKGLLLNSVLWV